MNFLSGMALFVAISKWNSLLSRHIQNYCGCSIIVRAEVAMGTPNSPRCLHGPKLGNLLTAASPLGFVLISFFQYFSSQRKKQNFEIMQPSGIFFYLAVIWAVRCLGHLGHHSFFSWNWGGKCANSKTSIVGYYLSLLKLFLFFLLSKALLDT